VLCASFAIGVGDQIFEKQTGLKLKSLNPFPRLCSRKFMSLGFAQLVMLDRDFQKKNDDFKFVRQEVSWGGVLH